MNLSARFRKFLLPAAPLPAIEPLEARIAPASLISSTEVTFNDKSGNAVTVTITKPLFSAATIAKVFTFDSAFSTGSTGGVNSTGQQLELLNITKLGPAASGMDITIASSPGLVNVGYINSSGIDLGNVSVSGDLGRIYAGNPYGTGIGLESLSVGSLGQATGTQLPGGNLLSRIAGPVESITITGGISDGNLLGAIGIGGQGGKGYLKSLTVTGSIEGGALEYSGSVRTQGGIGSVVVDGGIYGGSGANSGVIGTAGKINSVLVEGDVTGSSGPGSGAILSTRAMNSVQIDGNLEGGGATNSGEIGTASNLGSVTINGSVIGGTAAVSGVILATGNITSVTIGDSLLGGSVASAGEIGAGGGIGTVIIQSTMAGGAQIVAHKNIQAVYVNFSESEADFALVNPLSAPAYGPGPGPGITDSSIFAGGSIGTVTAGASGESNSALEGSTIIAGGDITSIDAVATGDGGIPISNSHVHAGAISDISATAGAGSAAIQDSGFDAIGNIGSINVTGSITGSVFVAGINLPATFDVSDAGAFDNTSASSFGFGPGAPHAPAYIGAITLTDNGYPAMIEQSTFLAGVHGAGADATFGTKDDKVAIGSAIGAITAPDGIDSSFFESGNIGATNSGAITNTNYLATDPGVSAEGIGPITVVAYYPAPASSIIHSQGVDVSAEAGIYNSTFISNAGIGNLKVSLKGYRNDGENAGIAGISLDDPVLFQAGRAIGNITVIDSGMGPLGTNYGLIYATFNAGLSASGGVGNFEVQVTDAGPDGSSYCASNVRVDASVSPGAAGNIASIYVENDDQNSDVAGITDSVFRAHGSIGPIGATIYNGVADDTAIGNSTFSAFGSIGAITVEGSVTYTSRFLAGYDIGPGMMFDNGELNSPTRTLNAGQSVGDVNITGYFEGSDIIASVDPGAGYIFGGDGAVNTNVGSGGSIGEVHIATAFHGDAFTADRNAPNAIEAASIDGMANVVIAFGTQSAIPVILEDGLGGVRITDDLGS